MSAAAVGDGKLPGTNLVFLVEYQMMPGHRHGTFATRIAAKEPVESLASFVHLLVRGFRVDGIDGKAFCSFGSIALVPSLGHGIEQLFEFPRIDPSLIGGLPG